MSGDVLTPVRLHGGRLDLACDWLEIDSRGVVVAVTGFQREEVCDLHALAGIKGYVGGLLAEAGPVPVRCYLGDALEPYDEASAGERRGYQFWRFDGQDRLFLHRPFWNMNVLTLSGGRWHDLEDEEQGAELLILATALTPLTPPAPLGARARLSPLAARRMPAPAR